MKKNRGNTIVLEIFPKHLNPYTGYIKQILLAYDLPIENVNAVMMLNKIGKAMVRSPDGDTEFFEIAARVLQGNLFAP